MNIYKKQLQDIFNQTKQVPCPAFNGRNVCRIQTNIRLLPRAIKVLQRMPYFQEESAFEKDKAAYKYWAFEAVIEERRVKVVVRQLGNGHKHFWSVIPAWRRDRFGILNAKSRILGEDD